MGLGPQRVFMAIKSFVLQRLFPPCESMLLLQTVSGELGPQAKSARTKSVCEVYDRQI